MGFYQSWFRQFSSYWTAGIVTNDNFSLNIENGVTILNNNQTGAGGIGLFGYCNYYNSPFNVPEYLTNSTKRMFSYCDNLNSEIHIPEGINDCNQMFTYSRNLNANIYFDTDYIQQMSEAFDYCINFNQPVHIPNHLYGNNLFRSCMNLNALVTFDNGIANMVNTFYGCTNLNRNIQLPSQVTKLNNVFAHCTNLNQNIQIPYGVTDAIQTFNSCQHLDQNIYFPNTVVNLVSTFRGCSNLTQNIALPENVVRAAGVFAYCSNFNHAVVIPETAQSIDSLFYSCANFNQYISIPYGVTSTTSMFAYCGNFDQNIQIPSSVTSIGGMFANCNNLTHNIQIPSSVMSASGVFANCPNLPQLHVDFGASCNRVTNALYQTPVRFATLHADYYEWTELYNIFRALNKDYHPNLTGIRPSYYNYENYEWDYGDPLWQIDMPENAIIHYRYGSSYYNTPAKQFFTNQLRTVPLFGVEYDSYYQRIGPQPNNADDWRTNSWYQSQELCGIYGGTYNTNLHGVVSMYRDYPNYYYDENAQQNIAPAYLCLLNLY